jgi:hypothetical protein
MQLLSLNAVAVTDGLGQAETAYKPSRACQVRYTVASILFLSVSYSLKLLGTACGLRRFTIHNGAFNEGATAYRVPYPTFGALPTHYQHLLTESNCQFGASEELTTRGLCDCLEAPSGGIVLPPRPVNFAVNIFSVVSFLIGVDPATGEAAVPENATAPAECAES